jgi:hypothetical protein
MIKCGREKFLIGLIIDPIWHAIPPFSTVNEVWISLLEKIWILMSYDQRQQQNISK